MIILLVLGLRFSTQRSELPNFKLNLNPNLPILKIKVFWVNMEDNKKWSDAWKKNT
jgi:hypothetical protein